MENNIEKIYLGLSVPDQILQTALVVLTIVFLVWVVSLSIDDKED